ncbi:MAG: hypothetical protein WC260_02565 [Candidatus Pacearchaeota archaeon]
MENKFFLGLLFVFLISLADSASYPAPFSASNAVVIGSNAAASDAAAVSIATNLGMKAVSPSATIDILYNPGEDLCNFIKGCFIYDNDYHKSYCYPLGYRMNDTYCSEILKSESPGGYKKYEYRFLNQSEIFEICENHFECKSNFCFNNKCIGNIEDKINRLNEEIDNLKNLINKFEKNVELINESELINDSIEEKKEDTFEQKNYLKLFRKFLNLK